jgi:hypothetical protein
MLETVGSRAVGNSMLSAGRVEVLAGEPVAAERYYRRGLDTMRQIDEIIAAQALAPALANTLCAQGGVDEAARLLEIIPEPWEGSSVRIRAGWLAARGRICALRGESRAAQGLAIEGRALLETSDLLDLRGDVTATLAEVLMAAGEVGAARRAAAEAARLYQQKGNLAAAAHLAHL